MITITIGLIWDKLKDIQSQYTANILIYIGNRHISVSIYIFFIDTHSIISI